MTDGKLSRVHVGLALASALVVLLASGVAISRIGDDDERPVATGPGSTSSTAGTLSPAAGSDAGAGTASGAAHAGPRGAAAAADQAAAADALATAPQLDRSANRSAADGPAAVASASRTARSAGADPDSPPPAAPDRSAGSAGSPGPGTTPGAGGDGSGASGQQPGGQSGGGQGQQPPPRPSQDQPEDKALVAASVSAGEGAQGGVVGVALSGTTPEVDVTLGTSPVIGDHPPSEGTGVDLGGRLFGQPPAVPTFLG